MVKILFICHGNICRSPMAEFFMRDYVKKKNRANLKNMQRICGGDPAGKMHRLLDYTDRPGDVADPWYTGDFDATLKDVVSGCTALFEKLENGELQ